MRKLLKKIREKAERRIDKIITNRFDSLGTELSQELLRKDESVGGFRRDLERMVVRLNEKARLIERERQESLEGTLAEIKRGAGEILGQYEKEMKVRRVNDGGVREVVKELIDRVDHDLATEKKERTGNEDEMLEMMDGVCNRIQNITQ